MNFFGLSIGNHKLRYPILPPRWACGSDLTPSRSRAWPCCPASCTTSGPLTSTSPSCGPFIQLRELLATHKDLARKLAKLEKKYDGQFQVVFESLRQLMAPPPEKAKGRFGFRRPGEAE